MLTSLDEGIYNRGVACVSCAHEQIDGLCACMRPADKGLCLLGTPRCIAGAVNDNVFKHGCRQLPWELHVLQNLPKDAIIPAQASGRVPEFLPGKSLYTIAALMGM